MSEKYRYSPPEKKNDGRTLFLMIGLLLVLIVLGAGALIFIFMGIMDKPPPLPIIPDTVPNITDNGNGALICDDQCVLAHAISSGLPEQCLLINDSPVSEQCNLYFSNSSLAPCLRLQNESARIDCIIHHAVSLNDSGICNNLDEPDKTSCKIRIEPCLAKSGSEKLACEALLKEDYLVCGTDGKCLFEYAKTTGNTGACSRIPDAVMESACKSIVSRKDHCHLLSLKSQKDLCYQMYAIETNQSIICSQISPDTAYSLACASYFSVYESNLGICDTLSLNNRWICYTNYSFGTGDASGCKAIDALATTARFMCLFEFAKMFGDPSACDILNDVGQTTTCYVGSILSNPNLDYTKCSGVARDVWRNRCYLESAKLNNDPALCDFIATENERNNCKDNLD